MSKEIKITITVATLFLALGVALMIAQPDEADNIIQAQTTEIEQMRTWYNQWYK